MGWMPLWGHPMGHSAGPHPHLRTKGGSPMNSQEVHGPRSSPAQDWDRSPKKGGTMAPTLHLRPFHTPRHPFHPGWLELFLVLLGALLAMALLPSPPWPGWH